MMDTGKWFRANDQAQCCLRCVRHPDQDTGCSITSWHPGRPRQHHSMVQKATWEQILESSNIWLTQSPFCHILTNLPGLLPVQTNLPTFEENISMDITQWERMREFHSLPTTWSSIFPPSDTKLTRESALIWTMSQPSLEKAWCQTYTWIEEVDFKLANYCSAPTSSPMTSLPHISHTMWNYQHGSNLN